MTITAYQVAARFLGVKEAPGTLDNPLVVAMLKLDASWATADSIPWCSAYPNFVCWLIGLPRSKSLAARSWLTVGTAIELSEARPEFDIVVLKRGVGPQPGPEVTSGAPGHVGFFAGLDGTRVRILGGNQSNKISIATFPISQVLGVRRLVA